MSATAEYSIQIKNNTTTDFKLYHYGVSGQKAKTHQHPSSLLKAGSTEFLSWNVGNDRFARSAGHAYWVAHDQAVFAIMMNGYDNGQWPYTLYQFSNPTGTTDGPSDWLRSGLDWSSTYQFCFAGEGKHYKAVVANAPQDPEKYLYTVVMTIQEDNQFWSGK